MKKCQELELRRDDLKDSKGKHPDEEIVFTHEHLAMMFEEFHDTLEELITVYVERERF